MPKKIFMISGELSGDMHGASLIRELKKKDPEIEIYGMGGSFMLEAGLIGLDSSEIAVVGLVEVAKKLPRIIKAFRKLKKWYMEEDFDGLVLIDYPDFNLRFASAVRKKDAPVTYYISPQVWAWRSGRLKKIARLVDKMLVIFPFELDLYLNEGVDAEYIGHPLGGRELCPKDKDKVTAKRSLGLASDSPVIALLPGSRSEEVLRLLGPMAEGALALKDRLEGSLEILCAVAPTISDGLIEQALGKEINGLRIIRDDTYRVLRASDVAIVASGTATLECAVIGTPMVIVYKLSPLSYFVARLLIKIKCFGLPNIVAGRKFIPELIQDEVRAERICTEAERLIQPGSERDEMIAGVNIVSTKLGHGGAAERAATAILKVTDKTTDKVSNKVSRH